MNGEVSLLSHLLGCERRADGIEGFGQGFFADICFTLKTRKLRKQAIVWRAPTRQEAQQISADPFLGAFGDDNIALAWHDGNACLVVERMWHGWPDPPKYAVFAMCEGKVSFAADFHDWPGLWQLAEPGQRHGDS